MKRTVLTICFTILCAALSAQQISIKWSLSDKSDISKSTITGDVQYTSLVTSKQLNGSAISKTAEMTGPNAENGYIATPYDTPFTQFYVTTRTSGKTALHNVAFSVTPMNGHKFKPTKIAFDAAKCGTDGGNFDVYIKSTSSTEKALATAVTPLRNRIDGTNSSGYSHHEFNISDMIVSGESFTLLIYIYNINGTDTDTPKSIALRNVTISGAVDEEIFTAAHYVKSASITTAQGESIDLNSIVLNLKNGEQGRYTPKLYGTPQAINITCTDGYSAVSSMTGSTLSVTIKQGSDDAFSFKTLFTITNRQSKPAATPLKRGLMSAHVTNGSTNASGNLVSWRFRESDDKNIKFKLFKGTSAKTQATKVNNGNFITNSTNFFDSGAAASYYYRLEVCNAQGELIETEISRKTWDNQTTTIPTNTPVDERGLGATYTANDASFCDMDGDGEYEIILKWDPSNSKDPSGDGVTSSTYFDCYKLDGTQLWRINLGPNLRSGAHTTPFLAWDFDGDGYGEFMIKTAPGTVDGEGNYVIMEGDDPTHSWLNGRGKPDDGPEYLTVFDGSTGAEISTIAYHTNYAAGANYWGDSNQNRSERYLACMAYLDGKHPSAIFARGYYRGAFVGAYDFDGENLTLRWLSKNIQSNQGLWGEGAHCVITADVDGDGCDEITYGSAALNNDGSLLYRTGLKHGDAMHLSDFDYDHDGLECFMVHEEGDQGFDFRDAKTGQFILRITDKNGSDTGRGLMADFSELHWGAEILSSQTTAMLNISGDVVANSWTIGSSGAGINARVYWTGTPWDEFYDKSIIGSWNDKGGYFDRISVNGGSYTWGSLNNASKNNPCVLGDLLGDWREEIVTRDASNNYLIINATNYESSYRVPHLMDDRQYAEAIVWQNVAYNQPPHLSYSPVLRYSREIKLEKIENTSGVKTNGDYWTSLYTSYPIVLPEGITAYQVTGRDAATDTLRMSVIKSRYIPADRAVVINAPQQYITVRPTKQTTSTVNGTYLKGALTDSLLYTTYNTAGSATKCYVFANGSNGLGFYEANNQVVEGGTGFLRITGTSSNIPAEAYIINPTINPTIDPTAITQINANVKDNDKAYKLDGRPAYKHSKGIIIQKGRKTFNK